MKYREIFGPTTELMTELRDVLTRRTTGLGKDEVLVVAVEGPQDKWPDHSVYLVTKENARKLQFPVIPSVPTPTRFLMMVMNREDLADRVYDFFDTKDPFDQVMLAAIGQYNRPLAA